MPAHELSAHDELRNWLGVVTEIAGAVTLHEPLSKLLNLLARNAGELMGFEFCAVLLADEPQGMLEIRGSYGLSDNYESQVRSSLSFRLGPQSKGETPSSRAFVSQQPVLVEDVLEDPLFEPWARLAQEAGFRSLISVPLVVNGHAVGTLNGYRARPCHFDQDEILLLAALANLAATAIETARLRELEQKTIGELRDLNSSLHAQTTLLAQAERIHRQLTTIALRAGGLDTVASVLAGLLARPVLIEDALLGVIAHAPYEGQSVDAPPIERRDSQEILLRESGDTNALSESATWPGAQPPCQRISVPVLLEGDVVARFWLPGRVAELGALELRAIEHAVVVSALELMRERTALDVEWALRGDLLAELLVDTPTDSTTVIARARNLGLDLRSPHALLVVRADAAAAAGSSDQRRLLDIVREATRLWHPSPLVTISGNHVVVLRPMSAPDTEPHHHTPEGAADSIRAHCSRRLRDATVSVSVGEACTDVSQYAQAFRMQRGVLELARIQGACDRSITLPNLGFYALLLQLDEPAVLSQFAEQTLAPLRRYDEAKNTELVATLRTYFAHDLNTTNTAVALFVHPNTVGLRLKKIESLLNLSLARPDVLLQVQAALMTENVLRLKDGPSAG